MMQFQQATWQLPPGIWGVLTAEDDSAKFPPDSRPGENRSRGASDYASNLTRVLVVDDEQLIADTLTRILNLNGFAATAVYGGDAALATLDTLCPDIVLSDVRMPGRNGIEVAILIRQQCPDTRIVLFSGQAGVSSLMDQARQNGYGFELWPKPLHPRELVRRLREL